MPIRSPVLAIDSASPVVSVAVAAAGRPLAERTLELRRSSEGLLRVIDEVLSEAGLTLFQVAAALALQGPGSFTGLRIGLATVLGFHQALGLPATAWPTLPILASTAAEPGTDIVAAVDAMRGDWMTQRFRASEECSGKGPGPGRLGPESLVACSAASLMNVSSLAEAEPCRAVGFGLAALELESLSKHQVKTVEPLPLASFAASFASRQDLPWDPGKLTAPIYFRPPAVTLPARS